jgi:hypothetical protein
MNKTLTICQLWFRLARVFNVFAREPMRVLVRKQNGAVCATPPTPQHQ